MSRSEIKKGAYHHGDLRNALIEAGVTMLGEEGEQALSMRKLAKQAGVSHNAPYMHFTDKEALLAAIAEEGFHILSQALTKAISLAGESWRDQLQDGCWAYVQFALEHPSHLQVMFRYYDPEKYPSLSKASSGSLEILSELVKAGQVAQLVIQDDSKQLATLIWSLLHGVAIILAGHKMPPTAMGDTTPQELTRRFIDLLYSGLAF